MTIKHLAVVFLLLGLYVCASAGQIAVTSDGKSVFLDDSGTWRYSDDAEAAQRLEESGQNNETVQQDAAISAPNGLQNSGQLKTQLTLAIAVSGVLVTVILCGLVYFFVLLPGKKRKPLLKAMAIIANDQIEAFEEAESLLDSAITSGLKKDEILDAYFARAYVKIRLGKFDKAVADIAKADMSRIETIYCDLWVKVKLEKYREAYDLYLEHGEQLREIQGGANLLSIACLSIGKEHWKNHEIDDAIPYFQKVRELKIHSDLIPQSIGNHQITLGIKALFDGHLHEAESYFQSAAAATGEEDDHAIEAEVGLLLCEWRREDYPDIDDRLLALEVATGTGSEEEEPLGEQALLARNIRLWQAVSLIFTWLRKPGKSGLRPTDLETLKQRLDLVIALDPGIGDPWFIQGLIGYYFGSEDQRDESVDIMKRSGVRVPEVEIIIQNEEKIREQRKKSLETFLGLAQKYLTDRSVPVEMRRELQERLERFSRFRTMSGEIEIEEGDDEAQASVQDIKSRSDLLCRKINSIIRHRVKKNNPEVMHSIENLMERMDQSAGLISEQTRELEKSSQELMINTSEFLFQEEDGAEPDEVESEIDTESRETEREAMARNS